MLNSPLKSIDEEIQSNNYHFILFHIPQNPPLSLTKHSFCHMNSAILNPKTSLSDIYCISLIYLIYLNQPQIQLPITLAEMASNIYLLLEKTQGSLLNSQLLSQLIICLRQTLIDLPSLESQELLNNLDDEILGASKSLIFPIECVSEADHIVERLNVLAHKDKPLAIMEYLDFLCTGHSLKEQLMFISKYSSKFFENLLKAKSVNPYFHDTSLTSITQNPKDLFLSLHKFLDTVILQYRYSIIMQKENAYEDLTVITILQQSNNQTKTEDFSKIPTNLAETQRIITYEDLQTKSLLKRFPVYESFEPILDFLLKNLVFSRESISQEMKLEFIKFLISIILDRLWDIYPQYQPNMKDRLLAIFKELDRENLHICQLQAGFLLYEKLKGKKPRSNEFILELLNENPQIKNSVESFQKEGHKYYKGPGMLKELILKENCPINQLIISGGFFTRNIEVMIPGTILYWVFATRTLDIEFEVEFIGTFEGNSVKNAKFPQILVEKKRLDTGKKVQRGLILAKIPGLYRFCWDNRYSWFTEKFLRYRLFLLEPVENDQNESFGRSPYAIFNSCRDILGFDEANSSRKNSQEQNSSDKTNNKPKIKETLESVYKWQGNLRVIVLLKEKNLEIRALNHQKSFELLNEFEMCSPKILKDSFMEVLYKVSLEESNEIPEILFLKTFNTNLEIDGFPQTFMSFSKAYLYGLLTKFVEIGGDISGISRKPIPFSRIMIMSLIEGELTVITFNELTRNLAECLIKPEKTYLQAFKEGKSQEISLKCLINSMILLKFRPQKVIINRFGLFPENFTLENLRKEVVIPMKESFDMNEKDIEDFFLKNNVDFELFNYEFRLESLLK